MLTNAEETANTDNNSLDVSGLVDQQVIDRTEAFVIVVIDTSGRRVSMFATGPDVSTQLLWPEPYWRGPLLRASERLLQLRATPNQLSQPSHILQTCGVSLIEIDIW